MPIDPNQVWTRWGEMLVEAALNVLAAAAILGIGLWIANWAGRAMRRMSNKHPRIDDTLASFFAWIVQYALIGFVIIAVLNRFGVATTSIVAVVGASALAVGLALQGTLSNLAAGVMLMLFRPYRLGDFVNIGDREGTVTDINLFTSELKTPQNAKIVLPNSICWGAPMTNFTAHPYRRIDLDFSVSYDTDLNDAIAVLEDVVEAETHTLPDPPPSVHVKELGDFAVVLWVRVWVRTADFMPAKLALIKAAKEALDAHGIAIPFPTSTNYEIHMQQQTPSVPAPRRAPRLAARGGHEEAGDD